MGVVKSFWGREVQMGFEDYGVSGGKKKERMWRKEKWWEEMRRWCG